MENGHRVPPHDLDAERAVIGAMLVSPAAVDVVADTLGAEDFYSETHRVLYGAMARIAARNEPVDQLTVSDELKREKEFDRVGGREYVFRLVESVPTAANTIRHAEMVRGKAELRAMIDAGSRMQELAFEEPDDVGAALDGAEQMVYELNRDGGTASGFESAATLAPDSLARAQERYENGFPPGTPTGFRDLDRVMLGVDKDQLILVAARPAVGKTAFALSCIRNVAVERHEAVAMFSLEMSKDQLIDRLVSMESGIPSHLLATGNVPAESWTRLVGATTKVGQAPLHVDDTSSLSVAQMRPRIRRLSSRLAAKGTPLKLVVVDYIGLMSASASGRRGDNRQQEVADISRGLKVLSREFGVPVVGIAQLSRAVEQRENKRPMLSDLRDSGGLEADADKVLLLYRDEYYNPDSDDRGIAEVNVAKHRNGPTGMVKMAWRESLAKFDALQY